MAVVQHPSGIDQKIVDKVVARRGSLYAFPSLNPVKTALIVIDLDMGTGRDDPVLRARIIDNVNTLANRVRARGGVVAWITTPIHVPTENFRAVFGDAQTNRYEQQAATGVSQSIWPELNTHDTDIRATKEGHSAFFPGRSNLHEKLQALDIESLLIAGAVTNVCCEASARDAAELQYKVTMISDACIGWSESQDAATFATFFRCYGDVRPTQGVLELFV